MKTMKYLFIGAVMLSVAAPAIAQDGSKADVDAVKALIASKQTDAKSLKPFYNKNKKNAENLTAFGRAFYEAKDTTHAREYAEYGMKLKYAPAYILRGDIAALSEDGGGAAGYYDQAIYFDPKNPEAYRKYASVYRKISPEGAVAKLNELRSQVPNYPVDAIIGHINYISNNFDEAIGWLKAYRRVRTYSLLLDEKLKTVESELVKVGVAEENMKPILAATGRLVGEAARILDMTDVTTNSVTTAAESSSEI